ncbi:hypothetical protein C7S14_8509 [Burkholderia cepacia]|nr:hypothetical protein C7S14_8509 [Burkholderia cepacia]
MVGRVHACDESGQSVVPIGPAAGVPLRATPIIGRQSNTRYRHTIASDIHSAAAPFAGAVRQKMDARFLPRRDIPARPENASRFRTFVK